jgi:hypothetical protein
VFKSQEKDDTRVFVKSRPGLFATYTNTPGTARGSHYWVYSGTGYVFAVIDSGVWVNGTLLTSLETSTGAVGFTEHVDDTGTVSLFLVDGNQGYIFANPTTVPTKVVPNTWVASTAYALNAKVKPTTSTGFYYKVTTAGTTSGTEPTWPTTLAATVTDGSVTFTAIEGSFPVPHIPQPVFLDGYVFLAKANTQDVYNSNLNEIDLWDSGNFISAELFPDRIQALSRNNNYIYAIGNNSVEYLYDNAGTTSPLSRHDSAVQQFGTISTQSVVQTDTEVIMVGETANGGHTVWTIDGFKGTEIGTPAIRSILRNEGAALLTCTAYCIRAAGHKLYVLCLTNITLVYSFDVKMWFEWTSGVEGTLPFIGVHGSDGPNGTPYVLGRTDGKVYTVSAQYFDDGGTAFLCELVTPKYDFDVFNRKFMSRLSLIGDKPDTSGTNNTVTVSWTDDDYQTWSAERSISFDYEFPSIAQLGHFRRRAFRFRYNKPKLLRLEEFEVDINKGTQ